MGVRPERCSEGGVTLRLHSTKHFMPPRSLFFLLYIPAEVSADCQPPWFLPGSEQGRGSRAQGVPDQPFSAANIAGAQCQAVSEQGLGTLTGLETASLGRRRRIQASQARRKVGKSAKIGVGSLQGASIRAIHTNNKKKKKIKKLKNQKKIAKSKSWYFQFLN